ncbi:hypothetical protein V501_08829 [Pseudogymnoascus sp. VKM F-4519 (FW-2642)]|nr:hypothetical protein V501_08829 [Pseudogymnoascus sp. VKM F-4519 (FW-2642)]
MLRKPGKTERNSQTQCRTGGLQRVVSSSTPSSSVVGISEGGAGESAKRERRRRSNSAVDLPTNYQTSRSNQLLYSVKRQKDDDANSVEHETPNKQAGSSSSSPAPQGTRRLAESEGRWCSARGSYWFVAGAGLKVIWTLGDEGGD